MKEGREKLTNRILPLYLFYLYLYIGALSWLGKSLHDLNMGQHGLDLCSVAAKLELCRWESASRYTIQVLR